MNAKEYQRLINDEINPIKIIRFYNREIFRRTCQECNENHACNECKGFGDCPHCKNGFDEEGVCVICDGRYVCVQCNGTGDCPYCAGTGIKSNEQVIADMVAEEDEYQRLADIRAKEYMGVLL